MGKISIIIPIYNKKKYLHTLFQDLTAQSFADYECILIDDGSTDGSGRLVDELAGEDGRFRVFHTKNQGVSGARNTGLANYSGDYLTFVDADDRIEENYLQNLYERITSADIDMVISGHCRTWENSEKVILAPPPRKGLHRFEDILTDFATVQKETGIYGWCWAKLFKKELCKDLYFDEHLALAEDFEFYLRLYPRCKTIYFDESCGYRYLQGAENSSVQRNDYLIDYMSQLQINLRYKKFFNSVDAYDGENKAIVSDRISNYVFFTLYYSKIELLKSNYDKICQTTEQEDMRLCPADYKQRWIFYHLKKRRFLPIKYGLIFFRGIRTCMGRK